MVSVTTSRSQEASKWYIDSWKKEAKLVAQTGSASQQSDPRKYFLDKIELEPISISR